MQGVIPLLESLADDPSYPDATQPSHLLKLANEAVSRDDLPFDKIRGWLGYIQGVLIARGQLDMDAERDRTRPIFHHAYEAVEYAKPATVDVRKPSLQNDSFSGWEWDVEHTCDEMFDSVHRWASGAIFAGLSGTPKYQYLEFPLNLELVSETNERTISIGLNDADADERSRRSDYLKRVAEKSEIVKARISEYSVNSYGFGRVLRIFCICYAIFQVTISFLAFGGGEAAVSALVLGCLYAVISNYLAIKARDRREKAALPRPLRAYIPWLANSSDSLKRD